MPYLLHSSAATAYDAVWSLALAWNEAIPELVSNTNVCDLQKSREVQTMIAKSLNTSVKNFILSGISVSTLQIIFCIIYTLQKKCS